jgi:hypothetical protein
MFGVAAFGGRIAGRAARGPSGKARRDYLPAAVLAGRGCDRAGVCGAALGHDRGPVLFSPAGARMPRRDGYGGILALRGHPPLAGLLPVPPAETGRHAEHIRRRKAGTLRPTGPWQVSALVLG